MNEVLILRQMCTEDVYRKNAFHILGLPTDATIKAIRRRREDLDSAWELGEESWRREFRHWLCKTNVPDKEAVAGAFTFIEDPANRIVSEFFWVWPMKKMDSFDREMTYEKLPKILDKWLETVYSVGDNRSIAQHNLAVIYQHLAIEGEFQMLEGQQISIADVKENWAKSFKYWESLAYDDDFWRLYEKRLREFDDPRLTSGFLKRLRDEFPIAFDNINARLAFLYAKQENERDARRHVQYMKKTMSGIDDVAQTLENLFMPLQRQVHSLIVGCDERVRQDPAVGAECFENVLDASSEIVVAAKYLLEADNGLRERIFSEIFQACNGYLIAFGNKTTQWSKCLELNKRLHDLACTPELLQKVDDNENILQANVDQFVIADTCCGCGKRSGERRFWGSRVQLKNQKVKLYGNIRRNYESFGGVVYSTREIDVPCCEKCSPLNDVQIRKYPPLMRAMKEGFKIGDAPTQTEMRLTWGLPAHIGALPRHTIGYILSLRSILLATLTGYAAQF